MRRGEREKSSKVQVPDFQKDVIIPQIYDLANIKLIQSYGFKDSPINKVAELKKKKIEDVITAIVTKQKVRPGSTVPLHESLSTKKDRQKDKQRSHSKILENIKNEVLFMEIDEHMGEMMALAEENFGPFAERVKNVLTKARHKSHNKELQEKKREADFFIKVISQSPGKRVDPDKIKHTPGMLDDLKELQRIGRPDKVLKKRAQSAQLIRNFFSVQQSQLYKSNTWRHEKTSNLKQKATVDTQLSRSRQILQTINDCLQQQNRSNAISDTKMKEMKGEWSSESQIVKTFIRSSSTYITSQTLQILKEKRLKMQALGRIDKEYFRK